MIRLLHFADFHLGMENYGRLDAATGLSSRVGDFLRTLDAIVDAALGAHVDAVLFAGDAYRSRDPSLTYQREFSRRIGKLASAGIDVLLLVGNHDLPNAIGKATPMDIYETLAVERIHVFSRPETRTIRTRGGPLQIVALPWVRREGLLTTESLKSKSADEVDLETNEVLRTWVDHQIALLDRDVPAILLAHATIAGATYGSERKVLLGRDLVLAGSTVDRPEFSYVALGHIHKHQRLGAVTPVVYSGSTERIDFGEEREPKGFMEVEVVAPGEPARFRFHELPTRPFATISVALNGDDPTEQVLAALARQDVAGSVVRVVVEGTNEQFRRLRRGDVVGAVRDAHYFAGVQLKAVEETRRADTTLLEGGLTTQEVLRRYFASKNVEGDRLRKLMEAAEEIIAAQQRALR